jgi:hypothetical protein
MGSPDIFQAIRVDSDQLMIGDEFADFRPDAMEGAMGISWSQSIVHRKNPFTLSAT